MWVTMSCKFPNPCWFAINAQAPLESLPKIIQPDVDKQTADNTLETLNKYWDIFYTGWQARPNKPGILDKTRTGLVIELIETAVDAQIEVMNDIRHEKYKNENLYTDVERDRVETVGFKPVYSPGGFQI